MLKPSNVEAINNQLEDLDCTGHRLAGDDLVDAPGAPLTGNYLAVCDALLERLSCYDGARVALSAATTASDLHAALAAQRKLHFTATASLLRYRLVSFLCSTLQAERLVKLAATGDSRRAHAGERSKVLFQLDKICRDMQISSAQLDTANNQSAESEIVRMISDKVAEALTDIPLALVQNPPTILSSSSCYNPQDPPSQLTDAQAATVRQIEDALYNDFTLRRQMLLKRLDVTIKSFLWGDKAQGKEGEIVAAIKAQRENIAEAPTRYTLADALAAPVSLLHEHSKRVTDSGGRRSLVKVRDHCSPVVGGVWLTSCVVG